MTTHLTHAYLKGPDRAARASPTAERKPARNGMRSPARRRHPTPEVIRLVQGQLPKLPDATDVDDAEPVSQVRTCFPEPGSIQEIFREASRL